MMRLILAGAALALALLTSGCGTLPPIFYGPVHITGGPDSMQTEPECKSHLTPPLKPCPPARSRD